MTDTWYDCDACGYFGTECGWAAKLLPEDSDTMLCPECASEDFGESDHPCGATVFPTNGGWTWRVKQSDFHTTANLLPDNYRVDSDGDLIGRDVAGFTMAEYVLPRLASALIYPSWSKSFGGVELRRVFGRRQWARGL